MRLPQLCSHVVITVEPESLKNAKHSALIGVLPKLLQPKPKLALGNLSAPVSAPFAQYRRDFSSSDVGQFVGAAMRE